MAMMVFRVAFARPSDEVIGKWEMVGGEGRARFSADGTAKLTKIGGEAYVKWNRMNDGRLKIEGRPGSSGEIYQVAVEGDTLTMTKPDGTATKYKKVAAWTK